MANQHVIDLGTAQQPDRDAFGHWLSGFTDGEGSFSLRLQKKKRGVRPSAHFVIGLRSDDASVLREIRAYLNCGRLYDSPRPTGRPNWKPTVRLRFDDITSLHHTIIPHFERYPLRAKKRRDYLIWKKGVLLIAAVVPRERHWQAGGLGYVAKWTPDEVAEFTTLVQHLRLERTWQTGSVR